MLQMHAWHMQKAMLLSSIQLDYQSPKHVSLHFSLSFEIFVAIVGGGGNSANLLL